MVSPFFECLRQPWAEQLPKVGDYEKHMRILRKF
jgi:hypothetical protein